MAKGKKILRITGCLELLAGLSICALLIFTLQKGDKELLESVGIQVSEDGILNLFIMWFYIALYILTGIVGLLFANKPRHYKICLFFGIVLIAISIAGAQTNSIAQTVISLIIPFFYVAGAILNRTSR